MRIGLWTALVLSLVCGAGPAYAQQSCSVATQSIAFGGYQPDDMLPVDVTGEVAVTCIANTLLGIPLGFTATVSIAMDPGASGSFQPRTLVGPAGTTLDYNLFIDVARTLVWGDGSGGSTAGQAVVSNALLLDPQATTQVPIYGRIFTQQDVAAGVYADTIVVSITF